MTPNIKYNFYIGNCCLLKHRHRHQHQDIRKKLCTQILQDIRYQEEVRKLLLKYKRYM